jgi:hypothetical protein
VTALDWALITILCVLVGLLLTVQAYIDTREDDDEDR